MLHPRYVDEQAGGDGYGVWMEYPNDDYLQAPTRAVKQWKEITRDAQDRPTTRYRRTLYFPDRVERYARGGKGAWEPFRDNELDPWPIPWTTETGDPLGIPVIHLRNPGLKSELADIIPLQDALNKTWLDILAAEDSTSFRTTILLGLVPTTDGKAPKDDGSNLLKLLPGAFWASEKKPSEAQVINLDPATLAPLLEAEDRIVFRIASISGTPLNRFLTTRQVVGADSAKEGEGPLLGKVRERMTLFGNAWEDLIKISARIANRFGGATFEAKPQVSTVWEPPEVRNETAHLDNLGKKKELGVDEETVWTEMGYDKRKVRQFKREKKKRQAEMVQANARTPVGGETRVGSQAPQPAAA